MTDESVPTRYWGKYQGTVVQNVDPEMRGRLMCEVPAVLGVVPSSWCEACAPLAGPVPMGVYLVPPIGAGVWVEFEQGDPGKPIWTGCRFSSPSDPPPQAKLSLPTSPSIVLQTAGQNSICVSDMKDPTGGILLKTVTGCLISINDTTGITISDGKGGMINLFNGLVTVNQGALAIK